MNPKTAKTIYPVIELIRERWSPRFYKPGFISEEQMNTILEAACWSFSGGNLQPWYYLYADRETAGFGNILDCLAAGNQAWAKNAAVLMIALAKKERDPGKPNPWSKHDLGAANFSMILQARSMNIYGHPMGGFNSEKIIDLLKIDALTYEPVVCISFGYLGDPGLLDELQREKELGERTRKAIGEISERLQGI
jgi:nitroreductase